MTKTKQDFLAQELALVARMAHCYCEGQHGSKRDELCADCQALLAYVEQRLARCPYGTEKPNCKDCSIHCYRPEERQRIKDVMRYAGPRLLGRGDFGAIKHVLHAFKKPPGKPGKL
ncbi:MAG: nitrous oxide-stimulated promoter family protein [Armatimonadota bacterium]